MLKKLTLSNFQCHRKIEIEFSPTVTTIIGKNDAGKTAVLRALRYLCLNKPRGIGFIRRKQKRMIARLEFDNHTLIRKAGKVNSYSLDGKLFKAFRADVPQEIATALNVSDLNFQRQHDPVFWLSLSPGQLAKQLNSLVDLNTIDHTQTTISRRLRTIQTEFDFCNSARSDARRTRNNLYLVDKLTEQLSQLELLKSTISRITAQIESCDVVIKHVCKTRKIYETTSCVTCATPTLRITGQRALSCQASIASINRVIRGVRCAHATLNRAPTPNSDKLEHVIKQEELIGRKTRALQQLLKTLTLHQQEAEQCQKQITQRQKSLEDKLGGRCPYCFGILTGEHLNERATKHSCDCDCNC